MTVSLELRAVTKRFGGLVAVSAVDLDVPAGRLTSLVGPNGAGKSTLFGCICGQLKPTGGTITWDGQRISGRSPEKVARTGVARTFQTSRPFPRFSVLDNVLVGAHRLGHSTFVEDVFGGPRRTREERQLIERAMASLDQVGLAHLADRSAEQLAYGQRRLLEIARALVSSPRLLLLDEPAAGLNSSETAGLGVLLRRLTDDGLGVLLVEHNLKLVLSVSDHLAVLDFGELIFFGAPTDAVRDERVVAAYLGHGQEAGDAAS
ncbi:MAG: ABC transporter ATP-binding protein [Acidimicrobiales bacterium]|nr:ABC transporter ATP-binding protein [Acidimicrobiales bacterium]